jgi:hypothetical protein
MLFFPLRYKAPLAFPRMFSLFLFCHTIRSETQPINSVTKGSKFRKKNLETHQSLPFYSDGSNLSFFPASKS